MAADDAALEVLYRQYRDAARRGQRAQADLDAVDALLAARVCLYEHLVRTGWDAPPSVRRQIDLDAVLLEQPPSFVAG